MGGRKKQQGQQQHGNTRKFKVPGFTFRISSASPPQYATNKHQSWYIPAMKTPCVIASDSKCARGTRIAKYVATATTYKRHSKQRQNAETTTKSLLKALVKQVHTNNLSQQSAATVTTRSCITF